jgi:hypothetical protein
MQNKANGNGNKIVGSHLPEVTRLMLFIKLLR